MWYECNRRIQINCHIPVKLYLKFSFRLWRVPISHGIPRVIMTRSLVTTLWRCHDLRVPPNYRAAQQPGQASRGQEREHPGIISHWRVSPSHLVTWSHAGQCREQTGRVLGHSVTMTCFWPCHYHNVRALTIAIIYLSQFRVTLYCTYPSAKMFKTWQTCSSNKEYHFDYNQWTRIWESISGSEWADDKDYWVGIFDHFIDIRLYWYHEDNGHWELDNVVLFVVISGQAAVWPI